MQITHKVYPVGRHQEETENFEKGDGTIIANRKILRSEKGFTLIELLIVIAIVGILVGGTVLVITQFIGDSKEAAGAEELGTVQSAMDAMKTQKQLTDVNPWDLATDGCTNDMDEFPSAANPLSDYLRDAITEYWYTCTANGTVTGYYNDTGSLVIGVDDPP